MKGEVGRGGVMRRWGWGIGAVGVLAAVALGWIGPGVAQ